VVGAVTKFVVGFLTGSMAMISSAIDSTGDLIVSIVNLVVVRYSDVAPDADHNYGHDKIEGLGAMFEGGFVFAAGVFIIFETVRRFSVGATSSHSTLGIATMVPVVALTLATVIYLRRVSRATGSLVVKADAMHYATDVAVNLGVFVTLVIVRFTGWHFVDSIVSGGIALYMLWSSLQIVREGFDIVMDKSLDLETVTQLTHIIRACAKIVSFHDFKTRAGKVPFVDFHVVVRPDATAQEVHDVYLELEDQMRQVAGPNTRVLMHTEPMGAPMALATSISR
jgi:cation diffusion facilitator family transporter